MFLTPNVWQYSIDCAGASYKQERFYVLGNPQNNTAVWFSCNAVTNRTFLSHSSTKFPHSVPLLTV